ncbi:apolipoprotein N-acyltransferase [Alkalilimnicola ehrlichii]|uniref:Apolipoprotein N-acyltransferase n=1 Tax=Alkalilimnicola ehrlichii TaxID=351052 RepID=A0A3E0X0Q7_9GAMM|nr:apolipoprotein N-acyltransferase [Alkalilimnicola ehrlichii]RFA30266.1 apolipoprotein N-acyltransferase [Alkalilimnicola ehrlichii]RFA37845.1 apolipoprotein N-acyltransferase [Alkalilimnicola ehrlichii]
MNIAERTAMPAADAQQAEYTLRLSYRLSGWPGLVAALLAGAILPLAFAPLQWAWLAVGSPAVLFAIVAVAPYRQALRAGYLFGLGFFGTGVSWVYVSVAVFGAAGWMLAVPLVAIFVALLALFPWVMVWLAERLRRAPSFRFLVLVLPALWLGLEWVRSWLLTGFPWLLLGYSQTDTWLAGVAPVFGVFALSWLVATVAGLLAWVVLAPSGRRGGIAAGIVAAVLLIGPVLDREWTEPSGEPFTAVLIQGNMPQDVKWDPEYLQATKDRYLELTRQHWDADLIIWPESAIPLLRHQVESDYLRPLAEEAEAHQTDVLLGIPVFNFETREFYNSMVSITGEGGQYDKRHLVPFGEYLPLRSVFGQALDILGAPMADFVPGGPPVPLTGAGLPLAVSICYEVVFGRQMTQLLPDAAVLVNVSNDAWFGDSLGPHQHLQIARMRALEAGREMLRGTNTGITVFIDHRGQITHRAPQFETTTLVAEVTPRQGATPYVRWNDVPVLAALGLLLLGLAAAEFIRRRRR